MSIKVEIVGLGDPTKEIFKRINEHHTHVWEPVKGTSDVKCRVCGIKGMQSYLKIKNGEVE